MRREKIEERWEKREEKKGEVMEMREGRGERRSSQWALRWDGKRIRYRKE
jgi:hypothetical protein